MGLDLIRAIEACYAPIGDEAAWTDHLCAALAPLDTGLGLGAGVYDVTDPARPCGVALRPWGAAQDASRAFSALPPDVARRAVTSMFAAPPRVTTLWRKTRALDHEAREALRSAFTAIGVPDAVGVFGAEPAEPRGVLVAAYAESADALPARTWHQLATLSAHLLAAYRLRRGGLADPEDGRCDAVLGPDGRVEDARGAARARSVCTELAGVVRRIERVRARARAAEGEEATALWRGVVDGTWTLVDHVEAGGRRRILAIRVATQQPVRGLTDHEARVAARAAAGLSNKAIAYELGVSPSTVAMHLDHAARKLGARSRTEFIRAFAMRQRAAPAAARDDAASTARGDLPTR